MTRFFVALAVLSAFIILPVMGCDDPPKGELFVMGGSVEQVVVPCP